MSYFKAQEEKISGVKKDIELIQRKGSKTSSNGMTSANKSKEAAFGLLIELVKKSSTLMEGFLT